MTSIKYRVLKKMKSGTSLPLSMWLHSSNQSHVSELPTQGFFRLDWKKIELTVHLRNHLNRLKHMSPDHSLDFDIRHRPYTNMHPCKEGYLTCKNSFVYMPISCSGRLSIQRCSSVHVLSSSTQAQGCLLPFSNHVHQVTGDSALPQEPYSKCAFGSLPFWCDETGFRTSEEALHFSYSFGRKVNTAPHLLWLISPTIIQGADESFAWDQQLVTYSGICTKVGELLLELVIFEQNPQGSRLSNSLQSTGRITTS